MPRRILITAGIAAVAVIATVAVRPTFAAPVAIGFALAILAWFAPRAFVGCGLLLVVLSSMFGLILPDLQLKYLDELVIIVALAVLSVRRAARRELPAIPGWSVWFAAFFAVGLFSSLINAVPTSIALEGGFLAVKAVAFGLAAAQVDWRPSDLKPFVTGGAIVTGVIFVTCVINLISPGWWTSLILGTPTTFAGELGLPALIGPFEHPAALGRIAVLLAIAILAYRVTVRSTWVTAVLLAMASFAAIASFRVKTVVSLIASILVLGVLNFRRVNRVVVIVGAILGLALAIPLVDFVAKDVTQYLIDTSARSLMTVGSLDIAAREFPFGAGFGRFGSYTASIHYSPEYIRLDFESQYGMGSTPGRGQFLNDTQWPAILGETGWLGALLFAGGLTHMAWVYLRRSSSAADPHTTWVKMTGIGWLTIVIIESIGAPVFTSAPAYPLPFVAAGVFFALQRGKSASPALRADVIDVTTDSARAAS